MWTLGGIAIGLCAGFVLGAVWGGVLASKAREPGRKPWS